MKTDSNTQVYPHNPNIDAKGLTLRQYFTAMAMQGFCASAESSGDVMSLTNLADKAVEVADLTIAALNKSL